MALNQIETNDIDSRMDARTFLGSAGVAVLEADADADGADNRAPWAEPAWSAAVPLAGKGRDAADDDDEDEDDEGGEFDDFDDDDADKDDDEEEEFDDEEDEFLGEDEDDVDDDAEPDDEEDDDL